MQDPRITIEKEKIQHVNSPSVKRYRGGVFWYHKIDLGDLDAGSISCCSRSAKTKREQPLPQCREALKTRGKLRKFGSQWKKPTSAVYPPSTPPVSIPACRNQSKPRHIRKTRSAKIHKTLPALPFPRKTPNPSPLLMDGGWGEVLKKKKI